MKIPLRHLVTRADSTASSSVDLPSAGMKRTQSMEEGERTPARHSRHLTEDPDTVRSPGPENAGNDNAGPATDAQPRLVGLSQPFFASSQPMESPGSQPAAMEKITAEATRGGKIRVLVAEGSYFIRIRLLTHLGRMLTTLKTTKSTKKWYCAC